MNFDLTEDQKMIVETAASFAKKQSPVTRFRALRADATGWEKSMWKQMGELGWLGICFPEAVGGFGGNIVDAGLILEQLGTTLVPEPYLASVVLAGSAALFAGDDAQKERLLAPMIAGDTSLALAWAERTSRYEANRVRTRAEKSGSGYKITGEKAFVLNGHAADQLIVSARSKGGEDDRDGVSLFVVDPKAKGVRVQSIKTMDGHHAAMIRFDGVEVGASDRLGEEGRALAALEHALDCAAAGACSEGLGVMRRSFEMTVEYLNTRKQFGVRIGSFQVLQHRAVDMFIELESAKSTAILAGLEAMNPNEHERKLAISTAKVQLAASGKYVTQQAIQLHGGIGITDEHDIGLYFKRMHVLNSLFGDEEAHLARFIAEPTFATQVYG